MRPALKIPEKLAQEWVDAYNAGASIEDIRAREGALGRPTGGPVIKRVLEAMGVKLRTQQEAMQQVGEIKRTKKKPWLSMPFFRRRPDESNV